MMHIDVLKNFMCRAARADNSAKTGTQYVTDGKVQHRTLRAPKRLRAIRPYPQLSALTLY
jgi:hypothetical protein